MGIRSLLSNILVATGDAATQSLLKNVLDGQGRLLTVSRARQALSLARSGKLDVAVLELSLPGAEGLGLLKDLLELQPEMEIICLTGEGNIRDAVETVKPYGVDLSSSLEEAPGIKSEDKIREFFKEIRK